jgi:hypothetical protein
LIAIRSDHAGVVGDSALGAAIGAAFVYRYFLRASVRSDPSRVQAAVGETPGGTVWDRITPTQPVYEGSPIPRSFELTTESGRIWVHPNASKHIVERYWANVTRLGTEGANIAAQQELRSLEAAVSWRIQNGVPYGHMVTESGWELMFSKSRFSGGLPVLKHALYQ